MQLEVLSARELSDFHERGYHIQRNLFDSNEVAELRREADRLLQRDDLISPDNMRCRWQPHYETGEMLFECFDPYFDLSPCFREYANHPHLTEMVRSLYGERGHVCHNQFIYKPPGSKGYSLHQDFIGWPIFPRSFMTVAIALDAADSETGCIEAFAGCHRAGYFGSADGEYHELSADQFDPNCLVRLELQPGDAAAFGCLLPHRSEPNTSPSRWRRTLFYCFNADSDGGEMREEYYSYYHNWKVENATQHGKTDVRFW